MSGKPQKGDSLADTVGKALVVSGFSFLGMFGFSMIGSLAYPIGGVGAIGGAITGFFLFATVSFCATGLWHELIPAPVAKYGVKALAPSWAVGAINEYSDFTLIVTIHELKNLQVKGLMPWNSADTFCEIEYSNAPVQATCVRYDGQFNEQFRINVSALEDSLLVRVKDQDIFGSTEVGYVAIEITRDILEEGFPYRKEYKIEAWENDKIIFPKGAKNKDDFPKLVVSFDHTSDCHQNFMTGVKYRTKYEDGRRQQREDMGSKWRKEGKDANAAPGTTYGTLDFLSNLEFNTNYKVVKKAEDDPDGIV